MIFYKSSLLAGVVFFFNLPAFLVFCVLFDCVLAALQKGAREFFDVLSLVSLAKAVGLSIKPAPRKRASRFF